MATHTEFGGAYGNEFLEIVGLVRFSKYPFHIGSWLSDVYERSRSIAGVQGIATGSKLLPFFFCTKKNRATHSSELDLQYGPLDLP